MQTADANQQISDADAVNAPALAADGEVSIRTRDLDLLYGNFQALFGVSVDIKPGIITSLIGPSGCGKTTLLRSFNRINERYGNVTTNGEISIFGKNIYDEGVSLPELRKAVGMVFQRPNPLPISIYENIIFGLKAHTPRRELKRDSNLDDIVEHALREVQLWEATKNKLKDRATIAHARTAAEALHRAPVAAKAAHHPHGRTLLRTRRRRDRADRRTHHRDARTLHDRHGHAQHGTGETR